MPNFVSCPACGGLDSLVRKFDAWAVFEIAGVKSNGDLALSDDFDTQVFDDNHIECCTCERQFNEDEIIQHLGRSE